ncbi:hypothetical protein BO82DRAFT_361520 [Aspergillus uvarum CBS 121591]|uniref:Uncharacterized protein n=1 Tax=Aspergillus uvarum CBS 121591 TaxID=1448315 RepID=A0A319E390_9EURO|nr:hypothetical protein BO82DRAFT_361520 [Aspergillus uvarum CBS 121591]PYH85592.1 hypothetical protein BO82DRAFT_361520 [Aspergillus uvarum CBS 121591]
MAEEIGVEAMGIFIHSNLGKLATLSHHARQRMEVRVSWAYINETPQDVVCGVCQDHDHSDADTRLWMCPMTACGCSAWHDTCLEGMYKLAARADRVLAFGCPACGTGWWLRSEMSAEEARLREEWEEFQMQLLLKGEQERFFRHLRHLYQQHQLNKQQKQQQQYHQTQQTQQTQQQQQQNSTSLLQSELWIEDT